MATKRISHRAAGTSSSGEVVGRAIEPTDVPAMGFAAEGSEAETFPTTRDPNGTREDVWTRVQALAQENPLLAVIGVFGLAAALTLVMRD